MSIETILKLATLISVAVILWNWNPQKKSLNQKGIRTASASANQFQSPNENQLLELDEKTSLLRNEPNEVYLQSKNTRKFSQEKKAKSSQGEIREIPDANNNWRSGQLSLEEMKEFFSNNEIVRVVRMNGNGKDSGGIKIEEEKVVSENYGVQFFHINYYSKDALQRIHEFLMEGNTLIHCRHGFDRTGGAVGFHLRKSGFEIHEVVTHNHWEDYRETKEEKYLIDYWEKIL